MTPGYLPVAGHRRDGSPCLATWAVCGCKCAALVMGGRVVNRTRHLRECADLRLMVAALAPWGVA